MIIFTKEKFVWIATSIVSLACIVLGIVVFSKPLMMETYTPLKALSELGDSIEPIKEFVDHLHTIIAGGFIAIFLGVAAIVISIICIFKNIHPRYTKVTIVVVILALCSLALGITGIIMANDLNNHSWFDKVAESHGGPPGFFTDEWERKHEIYG